VARPGLGLCQPEGRAAHPGKHAGLRRLRVALVGSAWPVVWLTVAVGATASMMRSLLLASLPVPVSYHCCQAGPDMETDVPKAARGRESIPDQIDSRPALCF
jgi:hypothetical protein